MEMCWDTHCIAPGRVALSCKAVFYCSKKQVEAESNSTRVICS